MDMDMDMDSGSDMALNASGVDFSNATQAANFLDEILDDSDFMITANEYARNFWYGIIAVIVAFTLANIHCKVLARNRLRSSAANVPQPARPTNIITKSIATMTAVCREVAYGQYTPTTKYASYFKVPPTGTIVLVVGYLAWVMLMEFMNNNVDGAQHYTAYGVRAGWLACAQVPLLILLAGKNNLIGLATGISYERLNVLHRWSARILLLIATLHMGFLHAAWNAYSLGSLEYSTDDCIPTGWATYAILLWMNISTIAPIRNFSYEFFIVQHILTFIGFIVAVMYHIPAFYARVYIWIPIGLFAFDRLVRAVRYTYNNIRPARATLEAMEGGVTKITVSSKQIKSWTAGSHVFLSMPRFGLGQSHPATILSTPESHNGDLVFILKTHKGFTSRIHKGAISSTTSLLAKETTTESQSPISTHVALIDGPYGQTPDFAIYDTLLLVAGSTGITFILSILLSLSERSKNKLPVKRITLLWIVKNTKWTNWVSSELQSAYRTLQDSGIEIDLRIHVTCDDTFTDDAIVSGSEAKKCACACDKTAGPCCCISAISDSPITAVPEIIMEKQADDSKERPKVTTTATTRSTSTTSSTKPLTNANGVKNSVLPCASFHSGRPDFYPILLEKVEAAEGESAVVVCGPIGLGTLVRNSVVKASDERAVHKGTGAQGIFLWGEGFGW